MEILVAVNSKEVSSALRVLISQNGYKDKIKYSLVPVSATKGIAKVFTFGAEKYGENNWQNVSKDRIYSALMRHIEAWRDGENRDNESGLLHLEHAICNLAMLVEKDNLERKNNDK